uniref:Uncharacterized protein n=1 Tax=Setaria italica TaxID=4555 RepID=K3XUA0_SETIT
MLVHWKTWFHYNIKMSVCYFHSSLNRARRTTRTVKRSWAKSSGEQRKCASPAAGHLLR